LTVAVLCSALLQVGGSTALAIMRFACMAEELVRKSRPIPPPPCPKRGARGVRAAELNPPRPIGCHTPGRPSPPPMGAGKSHRASWSHPMHQGFSLPSGDTTMVPRASRTPDRSMLAPEGARVARRGELSPPRCVDLYRWRRLSTRGDHRSSISCTHEVNGFPHTPREMGRAFRWANEDMRQFRYRARGCGVSRSMVRRASAVLRDPVLRRQGNLWATRNLVMRSTQTREGQGADSETRWSDLLGKPRYAGSAPEKPICGDCAHALGRAASPQDG
jgi:hypothetical protein